MITPNQDDTTPKHRLWNTYRELSSHFIAATWVMQIQEKMIHLSTYLKKNWAVLMSAMKRPDQSSSPWARAACQDYVSWHITSPSTSTCPNTYSVNCQPTCVGGEPCCDGAPEIGLQRCPKADIWLTALKRLSQPRLDFYKWLACFLHLLVTSKSRITIIFKDYLLLVQPEPLFRNPDHLAQTQNKRQSLLRSLCVKHVPWKQSSNRMNMNKLSCVSP